MTFHFRHENNEKTERQILLETLQETFGEKESILYTFEDGPGLVVFTNRRLIVVSVGVETAQSVTYTSVGYRAITHFEWSTEDRRRYRLSICHTGGCLILNDEHNMDLAGIQRILTDFIAD